MRIPLIVAAVSLGLTAPLAAEDRFVATLPADSALSIRRDIEYRASEGKSLKFDLYRPAASTSQAPVPVVILLNGVGADWMRHHVQYTGWARFVTTAGFAGVTMDATEAGVREEFDALAAYLRAHATELGVDARAVVVWACSANVRAGLPLVQDAARREVRAAVMYYGAADLDGTPLRADLPVLVVRAGIDNPGLNLDIDRLVARAMADNAPFSVINHPGGRHGFDLRDDNDLSRAIMAQTLAFMREAVRSGVGEALRDSADLAAAAPLLARQEWAAAVGAYERIAARRPSDPEPQQRLGEALLEVGDFRKAAAAFERALELGTNNRGIVSFAAARAYVKLGDLDRAMAMVERIGGAMRFFAERLRTDPDFAPLRGHPRFETVLASPPQ